jgi:cellulose biosynthesis protein BcsQ
MPVERPWTGRRVLSIANLKGGVGKSTTAMMIADALSYEHAVRVLLVDLDAQANTSRMILSFRGLKDADNSKKTLTRWVELLPRGQSDDLYSYVNWDVSGLTELRPTSNRRRQARGSLAIAAATPHLRFAELAFDHTHFSKPDPDAPRRRMTERLDAGLNSLAEGCDLVIFDCPPGFTTLAQAALSLSDAIISPMFEEQLSVWSLLAFRDFGMNQTLKCWDPARHRVLFTRVGNRGAAEERATARSDVGNAQFRRLKSYIRETSQSHRWSGRPAPDSYTAFNSKYGPARNDVRALGDEVVDFLRSLPMKVEA